MDSKRKSDPFIITEVSEYPRYFEASPTTYIDMIMLNKKGTDRITSVRIDDSDMVVPLIYSVSGKLFLMAVLKDKLHQYAVARKRVKSDV
jgi:hypothetical protein